MIRNGLCVHDWNDELYVYMEKYDCDVLVDRLL